MYPSRTKILAKQLFLQGESFNGIAKKIREQTGTLCRPSTIKHWSNLDHDGSWLEQRNRMLEKVERAVVAAEETVIKREFEEQLKAYEEMIQKGRAAMADFSVPVQKAGEAAELIDKGIRGWRSINAGLISLQYIQQVVNIINEEVKDEETKRRIAGRLMIITKEVMTQ